MTNSIGGGDFDPLAAPGRPAAIATIDATGFKAGQFVSTVMDNTHFYKNRPKDGADADKLLPRATSMKVISQQDSFVKVELDTGEIGFVPSVMVEDPKAQAAIPKGNEIQVYPLPEAIPSLPLGEAPPGGAIPTVINPNAPAPEIPPPPVLPPASPPPAPVPTND
jgi:hypothetical protein